MVEYSAFNNDIQESSMMRKIGERKIFVLDTNVLIHNPQAMFSFKDNVVVIPLIVIEEIDNFKKGLDEKGRNARQIGRYLDSLRSMGSLKSGVHLENDGYIIVSVTKNIAKELENAFFGNINDNYIIGTALYYHRTYIDNQVILISKDANVRIKADVIGVTAQNYETESIIFEELYTGIKNININQIDFDKYINDKYLTNEKHELHSNQFVRFFIEENNEIQAGINDSTQLQETLSNEIDLSKKHINGRYSAEDNTIYPLRYYLPNKEILGIKARNEEQEFAFELLLDDNVKMVSLIGKAGTGKTLLALAAGLHKVIEENKYTRLVVSRPISPLGKDIGFLPGSKANKFSTWMQPIYDNMEILLINRDEKKENNKKFGKKTTPLQRYLDFGFIELEPLTYIRGRSLPNQYIIIDEAQNLTPHEMKTIITRAGEGTKIVITGDPYQIDIPYLDSESNGLSMCAEKMKTEVLVGHITLEKGERSKLADIAAKYF